MWMVNEFCVSWVSLVLGLARNPSFSSKGKVDWPAWVKWGIKIVIGAVQAVFESTVLEWASDISYTFG